MKLNNKLRVENTTRIGEAKVIQAAKSCNLSRDIFANVACATKLHGLFVASFPCFFVVAKVKGAVLLQTLILYYLAYRLPTPIVRMELAALN